MQQVNRTCYFRQDTDKQHFVIGNEEVERYYTWKEHQLFSRGILNKKSLMKWGEDDVPVYNLEELKGKPYSLEISVEETDQSLEVKLSLIHNREEAYILLSIIPGQPFINSQIVIRESCLSHRLEVAETHEEATGIESEDITRKIPADSMDYIPFSNTHMKVTTYTLNDVTDSHNTLVCKSRDQLYVKKNPKSESFQGNMLLVDDYLHNEGLLVIKESPCRIAAQNQWDDDFICRVNEGVFVRGSGIAGGLGPMTEEWITCYGVTVGVGKPSRLPSYYKAYHHQLNGKHRENYFIMSNTWGDRNQDSAICESFILKEIERAASLGIDILQIDDGWQKGRTANSALSIDGVWEGYYDHDTSFWEVDDEKFPSGLQTIVREASMKQVRLGLWFSPDSSKDFANWERDLETIYDLHTRYGIDYFKLDGIKVRNKQCELNLIKLLKGIHEASQGKIVLNLDITAEKRLGYIYEIAYGTLFVENRYTDWGSYYPHATLRNLWHLSEIIPPQRLQIELLNNHRNKEVYGDDPLAPYNYDMTYLFAITMVANPLFWMELSGLYEKDLQQLKPLIQIYKKINKDFYTASIEPIGQEPDGTSCTGFHISCDETAGYILLFNEHYREQNYTFKFSNLEDRYTVKPIAGQLILQGEEGIEKNEWHVNMLGRSFSLYSYKKNM